MRDRESRTCEKIKIDPCLTCEDADVCKQIKISRREYIQINLDVWMYKGWSIESAKFQVDAFLEYHKIEVE